MQLLGIDNVFFYVGALDKAIEFYDRLGFKLKFKIPHMSAALFEIGSEEPGLMVCEIQDVKIAKLWVEVVDARAVQNECEQYQIQGKLLETATGFTFEIRDLWGNTIGFADYCKKPELARKI